MYALNGLQHHMKAAHCKGMYNLNRLEFVGIVANIKREMKLRNRMGATVMMQMLEVMTRSKRDKILWKFLKRRID